MSPKKTRNPHRNSPYMRTLSKAARAMADRRWERIQDPLFQDVTTAAIDDLDILLETERPEAERLKAADRVCRLVFALAFGFVDHAPIARETNEKRRRNQSPEMTKFVSRFVKLVEAGQAEGSDRDATALAHKRLAVEDNITVEHVRRKLRTARKTGLKAASR